MPTKTAKPKIKEEHWTSCVTTYLVFMEGHFSQVVKVDGATAKSLKNIVRELREQSEAKQVEWTKEVATRMLLVFFEFAWLHQSVIKSTKWFAIYSSRHKHDILDQIKKYKKQNHDKATGNR